MSCARSCKTVNDTSSDVSPFCDRKDAVIYDGVYISPVSYFCRKILETIEFGIFDPIFLSSLLWGIEMNRMFWQYIKYGNLIMVILSRFFNFIFSCSAVGVFRDSSAHLRKPHTNKIKMLKRCCSSLAWISFKPNLIAERLALGPDMAELLADVK